MPERKLSEERPHVPPLDDLVNQAVTTFWGRPAFQDDQGFSRLIETSHAALQTIDEVIATGVSPIDLAKRIAKEALPFTKRELLFLPRDYDSIEDLFRYVGASLLEYELNRRHPDLIHESNRRLVINDR